MRLKHSRLIWKCKLLATNKQTNNCGPFLLCLPDVVATLAFPESHFRFLSSEALESEHFFNHSFQLSSFQLPSPQSRKLSSARSARRGFTGDGGPDASPSSQYYGLTAEQILQFPLRRTWQPFELLLTGASGRNYAKTISPSVRYYSY